MSRFLIEVPHEANKRACAVAVQVFLMAGSHFLTNADWGCMDGEHKAWIVLDAGSKEEALGVVPAAFRAQAKIVQINKFTMEEVEAALSYHE